MSKEKKEPNQEDLPADKTDSENKKELSDKKENYTALGLSLGLCAGVVIGALTNHIGLYLPIGMCLGLAIGSLIKKK